MKTSTLLIVFLLLTTFVSAQQTSIPTDPHPRLIAKISPFHLFGVYPTIQFGLEYQFSKSYALVFEAGPSLETKLASGDFSNREGYRTKFEVRRYIAQPSRKTRIYVGPELYYNHINYRKTERYGVDCVDGTCGGFEEKQYGMRYRENGIVLKSGMMFKDRGFCVDIHFGFAIRNISYVPINKPVGEPYQTEDVNDSFFLDPQIKEKTRIGFSPAIGIRFGYVIFK